jgi:hypothetical protein
LTEEILQVGRFFLKKKTDPEFLEQRAKALAPKPKLKWHMPQEPEERECEVRSVIRANLQMLKDNGVITNEVFEVKCKGFNWLKRRRNGEEVPSEEADRILLRWTQDLAAKWLEAKMEGIDYKVEVE